VRNRSLMFVGVLALTFAVGTCKGDNGGTGPTGPAGSAGSAGPAGPSFIVGFARINTSAGASSVSTFGGAGTTGASVVRSAAGIYTVTFTGTYPSTTDATKLVVLSTAESNNFQVTNNAVQSASPTSISLSVFTWTSNALVEVDDSFFLEVLLGQ